MSKRDEDLVKVVRVTHPVRKLDLSWSSEEEKTKEESAKDLEEKLEAGTQETQEGQDQTGNSSWTMGTQHQLCPKILLQSSRYQSHQSHQCCKWLSQACFKV